MRKSTQKALGITLLVIGAIVVLLGFWLNALVGIDEAVGTAIGATAFVTLAAGFILLCP